MGVRKCEDLSMGLIIRADAILSRRPSAAPPCASHATRLTLHASRYTPHVTASLTIHTLRTSLTLHTHVTRVTQALLQAGALVDVTNFEGRTPIDLAREHGRVTVVEVRTSQPAGQWGDALEVAVDRARRTVVYRGAARCATPTVVATPHCRTLHCLAPIVAPSPLPQVLEPIVARVMPVANTMAPPALTGIRAA